MIQANKRYLSADKEFYGVYNDGAFIYRKLRIGNPGIGNRELGAGNQEPGNGNREPGTGYREQ